MYPENFHGKLAMMTGPWRNQAFHYAIVFLTTVVALLGTSYWITGLNKAPYPEPANFRAFASDEFLVTNRLDERYRVGAKYRSVEWLGMAPIAAFGSHAIKYMTSERLGIAPGGFMNFYVMHIGLPGVATLLRKLESSGNFPRNLVLVHLHNPHDSNWTHISVLVWDLPLHFYLIHSEMKVTDRIRFSLRHLGALLRDRLNYRIVLHELVYGSALACVPPYGIRRVGHFEEAEGTKTRSDAAIFKALGIDRGPDRIFQKSCTRLGGYRHDGSFVRDWAADDMAPPQRRVTPVKEETPSGGAAKIASLMREIDGIARRNGARAVFFVPPIFESDRKSENTRVLSRAIDVVGKDLTVLDHRTRYRTSEYFVNHGEAYFRTLAGELRQMGVIDEQK